MKLRSTLIAIALFGAATSSHAGLIPGSDAALLAVTKASWAKQVVDMANQLKEMRKQLDQAKAMYDSLHGSRGISNLLRNPQLYNYMPPEVASIMRANTSTMSAADAIRANLKLLGIEETSLDPKGAAAANFTARQNANANYQLLNEQAFKAANDRINQIDGLIKSIDGATDPAAREALNIRVNAEQARIANDQAILQNLAFAAAHEDRKQEQRGREIVMKATRGSIPQNW